MKKHVFTLLEQHTVARKLKEIMEDKVTFGEAYDVFRTTLKVKDALSILRLVSLGKSFKTK